MKRMLVLGLVAVLGVGYAAANAQTAAPLGEMEHAQVKGAVSTALAVTVGGKTLTLSMADLVGMAQKTVKVHNGHTKADETYSGVALTDVLGKAGQEAAGKALLRDYVKAMGTDGYWVLYSGIEIEGMSHAGDVIVATMLDGRALGTNGAFMLVSTEDTKPQRWVRNLSELTLVTAK